MNTRNCENCHANFSTGKEYGNLWCELKNPDVETKGLCEFCNSKTYSFALKHKLICTLLNCKGCKKPSIYTADYCNGSNASNYTGVVPAVEKTLSKLTSHPTGLSVGE